MSEIKFTLTPDILDMAAYLLEQSSTEFSYHGCNDLLLENTEANRYLVSLYDQVTNSFGSPVSAEEYMTRKGKLLVDDFALMLVMAKLFRAAAVLLRKPAEAEQEVKLNT